MSLQLLAKQMEAKGRKGDSMLVHMTPGEVAGLQKLAEAAGGSLSVNPETGLVEANFLKKLISSPMFAPLAGAGLMMIPGVGPMMAAGLVGGGTALATGDVGKGAMAGLGAYGGAGLAGGLMGAGNAAVSQAATAANPAVMGPMPGAASGFEAAKAGISGLGTEAGRGAFMQSVGGGAGLLTDASMAAAPMLTQEQKMAEAPVDDEMYSYEYNPGRTFAESTPSASSREEPYFNSSYSPLRRIKPSQYGAAQGGLMSLAEGGSTGTSSEGMTGASKAAFDYLMGRSAASGSGGRGGSGTFSGGDGMYSFDPATGQFTKNPNYRDPEDIERERLEKEEEERRRREDKERGDGGGGGGGGGGSDGPSDQPYNFPGDDSMDFGNPNVSNQPYEFPGDDSMDFGNPNVSNQEYGFPGNDSMDFGPSPSDFSGMSNQGEGGADSYGGWKAGGLMGLAKGGMRSGGFVVPADVVSMIGEGNTDAGYKRIKSIIPGATAIKGKDGGQSDTVKTHIEGKQPARVAHGEMYIPPETVKRMGGAKKLYAMMDRVRQQATGSKKQIKPVSLKRAMA